MSNLVERKNSDKIKQIARVNKRNHFLDIAKGIAIIMVCITHFSWTSAERLIGLFPFWISMAVPIFMLVTGYVSAMSFDKKTDGSIKELYNINSTINKLVRYIAPFLCMFIVQTILEIELKNREVNLLIWIEYFFKGGFRKYGTYYFPVLLQLTFLVPIIYWLIKKYKYGIYICFGVNLLYEIIKTVCEMDKYTYRLLAFRFIFAIAMGCYIYLHRKGKTIVNKTILCLGVLYILLISYSYYKPIIFNKWKNTSMMTILYIAPIFNYFVRNKSSLECKLLETLGRASYHIFLFQILYYNYFAEYISINNRMLGMAIGVIICLLGGYTFNVLYTSISNKIKQLKE